MGINSIKVKCLMYLKAPLSVLSTLFKEPFLRLFFIYINYLIILPIGLQVLLFFMRNKAIIGLYK
jgi:hypothetical protein